MLVSGGVAGGGGGVVARTSSVAARWRQEPSYSGASGRCVPATVATAPPHAATGQDTRTTYRGQGAQLCTKKQPLNELFLPLIIFYQTYKVVVHPSIYLLHI